MNDFTRGDIQRLKAQVDLVEVMRAAGLELEAAGKNQIARCPWHDDKEASLVVNPEKQLYNCFGCDAKGDVLNFLQENEGLSFRDAVRRLAGLAGSESGSGAPSKSGCDRAREPSPDYLPGGLTRPELLKRVVQHYAQELARSSEAQEYLKNRALGDVEVWRDFHLGYCGGSLLKTVPKGSETRQALIDLGVLNAKGREHFLGCVVVPLEDPEHGFVGLYGRRINPRAKVRHLFLPGPKRGLFNHQVLRAASSVCLTEGVLDAIALWVAGVRNVTCLHGTAGLTPDLLEALNASSVRELWLCVDADRAGDESVARIAEQTQGRFALSRVLLPAGSDPNSILVNEGPSSLRSFLDCRQPIPNSGDDDDLKEPDPNSPSPVKRDRGARPLTEATDKGFSLVFDAATYDVTPIPPFTGRLKAKLRAVVEREGRKKRFLDRLDFTSARARKSTTGELCSQLYLPRDVAEEHMQQLLDTLDHWSAAHSEPGPDDGMGQDSAPVLTEDEKLQALEFLKAPDLVSRVQRDMEGLGYVGEPKGKLLAYLVGLSRKLENPLSAIIRSQSGAGKSGLSSLIALLTPAKSNIDWCAIPDENSARS